MAKHPPSGHYPHRPEDVFNEEELEEIRQAELHASRKRQRQAVSDQTERAPKVKLTPQTKAKVYKIATENAEALYEEYEGAEGLWVTEDDLPSDPSEFMQRELKAVLSPQRLEEVLDGQPATEAELEALRKVRLQNILSSNYWDEDGAIPGYCLAEVADADTNTGIALILCTGTSLSGLNIWVHDVFDTTEAAKAYMKENGWMKS